MINSLGLFHLLYLTFTGIDIEGVFLKHLRELLKDFNIVEDLDIFKKRGISNGYHDREM